MEVRVVLSLDRGGRKLIGWGTVGASSDDGPAAATSGGAGRGGSSEGSDWAGYSGGWSVAHCMDSFRQLRGEWRRRPLVMLLPEEGGRWTFPSLRSCSRSNRSCEAGSTTRTQLEPQMQLHQVLKLQRSFLLSLSLLLLQVRRPLRLGLRPASLAASLLRVPLLLRLDPLALVKLAHASFDGVVLAKQQTAGDTGAEGAATGRSVAAWRSGG